MKIIVLDIETTDISPRSGIICEVGMCFLNLKTGYITRIFDTICQEKNKYINPNAWIFKNSSLTFNDVVNAPFLSSFKDKLQNLFDLNYKITAFNQRFDFGYLENRGFKIKNKFWDAMLKLTPILKLPRIYSRGEYKWPSVQEAWDFFFKGSDYVEKHRALDDAFHEAKIIYKTHKYY